MVKTTGVRGPTLARLAIVLVLATSGEPSTWFPLGGLGEQEHTPEQNFQNFDIFRNFRNFKQISNFCKNLHQIELPHGIIISIFY